jgi:hypothetical protein
VVSFCDTLKLINFAQLSNYQLLNRTLYLGFDWAVSRLILSLANLQAVHKVYRFKTMAFQYIYHNSGYYPSSCLLFETHQ